MADALAEYQGIEEEQGKRDKRKGRRGEACKRKACRREARRDKSVKLDKSVGQRRKVGKDEHEHEQGTGEHEHDLRRWQSAG